MNGCVKKLALFLTLCMLCTALSSCSFSFSSPQEKEDDTVYERVAQPDFCWSPDYTPVRSRYSYGELTEQQQKLYDLLLEQVYTVSPAAEGTIDAYPLPRVRVPGRLSAAAIRVTLKAIRDDNPALFWLSNAFSHYYDPDVNDTRVVGYSDFSPAKLGAMLQELGDAVSAFFAAVPSGLSEYEREKYAHDYLIDVCEYDHALLGDNSINEANLIGHCAYGALVKRLCVCEGYGMALQLLLNGLGVDCVGLSGSSYDSTASQGEDDAVLHLWNAVKLDGEWYHVDATWDDQEDAENCHDYFNLSDAMALQDHTLSVKPDELSEDVIEEKGAEDTNLFIPVCSGTKYYYFSYACPHLTDYDGEQVREAMLEAALNRETTFLFYIDPDYLDYDAAIKALFKDTPQYFFYYTGYVNDRLYDYEIDESSLVYYSKPSRTSVAVAMSYY